jgi:hypothetical protein
MTFVCPRCGYASTQPAHITAMRHMCQPVGRPAKEVALRPDPTGDAPRAA